MTNPIERNLRSQHSEFLSKNPNIDFEKDVILLPKCGLSFSIYIECMDCGESKQVFEID